MSRGYQAQGLVEPVFDLLARNPSAAAGTCTFAVAFALVAGNAFFSQPGVHPDPIWSTRDQVVTRSIDNSVQPEIRVVQTTQVSPRIAPVPTERPAFEPRAEKSELVLDLQTALSGTGHYTGEIDGLIGPRTREAIRAFQADKGLQATGEASAELLAIAERASSATGAGNAADPLGSIIAAEGPASTFDRQTVTLVQQGLSAAGISGIEVDGIYGSQTRQAIEQFQRQHALDVTGTPDRGLIDKMIDLGVLTRG